MSGLELFLVIMVIVEFILIVVLWVSMAVHRGHMEHFYSRIGKFENWLFDLAQGRAPKGDDR